MQPIVVVEICVVLLVLLFRLVVAPEPHCMNNYVVQGQKSLGEMRQTAVACARTNTRARASNVGLPGGVSMFAGLPRGLSTVYRDSGASTFRFPPWASAPSLGVAQWTALSSTVWISSRW